MIDVEKIFEDIEKLNSGRLSLTWLNPQSPIIKCSANSMKIPEYCSFDKDRNIIVKKSYTICVDYTAKHK